MRDRESTDGKESEWKLQPANKKVQKSRQGGRNAGNSKREDGRWMEGGRRGARGKGQERGKGKKHGRAEEAKARKKIFKWGSRETKKKEYAGRKNRKSFGMGKNDDRRAGEERKMRRGEEAGI